MSKRPRHELEKENAALRARLVEAEETLLAIRAGEVDAVVVGAEESQVYTFEAVETPYRLLVAQVPAAAVTLSGDGVVISSNTRFSRLVQRPPGALHGRTIHDFISPDSHEVLDALIRDGKRGDTQGSLGFIDGEGKVVQTFVGVRPLREGALGLCLLLTDLTEQRHYEELQRTQWALREADRKKDEFLATLAHELRNPLAPLRHSVEILKARGLERPEQSKAADIIDRQVQVMARLLDDLLDVSRIAREKPELRFEVVDLTVVMEAAIETSRPLIERARQRLTVKLPSPPVRLFGDAVRLAQVFGNLLNNAAKYTEEEGSIEISAERQGTDVVVSVRDDGMGIDDVLLPHVFELFSQARDALVRSQGGLGIGLSLVKALVELHGGTVEARSGGRGEGSEFVVRLPRLPDEAALDTRAAREASRSKEATVRKVLVADDNKDGAQSLAELIRFLGHDVHIAYDGEQAVAAAEALRPQVMLLDIGMPDIDGYEACRRVRAQPWGREVFLVAITGWGQPADKLQSAEAGFDRHLVKPVTFASLRSLLEEQGADQAGIGPR
jgi:PAS domain S-box-containing protein